MVERMYFTVASDATLVGKLQAGPLRVSHNEEFVDPQSNECPIMRTDIYWTPPDLIASGELAATDFTAYHGGDMADEATALLSLALRVRCKPGGRWWTHGIGSGGLEDPPFSMDHPQPTSPLHPRGHEVLPRLTGQRDVSGAASLIAAYPTLTENKSVAVMKAARQYQLGMWVANEDPNLAWIRLVGALEVAANEVKAPKQPYVERARDLLPDFAKTLEGLDEEIAENIAKSIAPLIGSTRKFLRFLELYCPPPPNLRPSEGDQVDWTTLNETFKLIYQYRSIALHGGRPFPQPMCEAPRQFDDGVPIERPSGLASGANNASWIAVDYPMLLATFEYMTQGALVAWWSQLGATS
ncbi:hypothetical protein [Micromonospora craniellae]|uniref:hypothetical protein n=1 Tax=Micromonospora craniellae TaxID=2294034 RepID=UPI0011C0F5A0|nr:hypothetical protein [Micromonospora craniellae]QOC94355.1 hypothetical protein ID554_12625 [Micromonospora craniellae]